MNIALRAFWSNNPLPIQEKINKPDCIIDLSFGNVLTLTTGVKSINNKTGDVILNAIDVGADSVGAAKNVFDELFPKIEVVQQLAETNQLNLSNKADQLELEQTNQQVELNRLSLLNKADLTALAMLSMLIDTKADQNYVNQQIANILNNDQEMIATITEISTALQQNEDLLEALDYTVANRVRFDVATQALTALQKSNARTNISAEEVGTAALLIAQITTATIGAATAAQGKKADTALQSADVAPVALSGLFSSLAGQSKLFDVVFSAYALGANSVISATDSLGQMLGKLQAQIDALKSSGGASAVKWVPASDAFTFDAAKVQMKATSYSGTLPLEVAKINGMLWVKGGISVLQQFETGQVLLSLKPDYKVVALVENGSMIVNGLNGAYQLRILKAGSSRINPILTLNSATLLSEFSINAVTQTINVFETLTTGEYHVYLCLGVCIKPV